MISSPPDTLPRRFRCWVHRVAELIDRGQLDGFTQRNGAAIRLLLTDIMRNRVDLPAPFGPMIRR